MSLNRVTLIGNLGSDPDLRYTRTEKPMCILSLAVNGVRRSADSSEVVRTTDWHDIAVFGTTAINCTRYLHKGSKVYVEGRLAYSRFTDREGAERRVLKILGSTVQFLSPSGQSDDYESIGAGEGILELTQDDGTPSGDEAEEFF